MNILPIIELAVTAVASTSVGAVIGNVVKATTPATLKTSQKVMVVVGTFVLTTVLGDLTARAAVDTVKETADQIKHVKDTFVVNPDDK